jgi:hypothetical protein
MKPTVRSIVFWALLIAAVGLVAQATLVKAQPSFHGTYAWTGFRSCVTANKPFEGSSFAIPAGAFLARQDSSESGTITFNKDGTGVTNGRASLMNITTTAFAGLSVVEFENHFTFTVDPDGFIDTESTGVTAATVLGLGAGGTSSGIGLVNRFQIVHGDMLLSAPQTRINPEQIFPAPGVTVHRLCTAHSLTATRLP